MSTPSLLLCFLNDDPLHHALSLRYWEIKEGTWAEKFDALAQESGLGRSGLLDTIRESCEAYSPRLRCRGCGAPHLVRGRSKYSPLTALPLRFPRLPESEYRCTACKEVADALARHEKLIALEQHRARVTQALSQACESVAPVDYAALDYVPTFFLYCAIVAANVEWEDTCLGPIDSHPGQLGPTPDLTEHVYMTLHDAGIISPAPSSDPRAFTINDVDGSLDFALRKVSWRLAPDAGGRSMSEVFALLGARLVDPEPAAVTELWYMIAESECRRYFLKQCERYTYIKSDVYTAKVSDTVRSCLAHLSIGQMWNIVFYVLKDLAALSQEKTYARQHVYNMIPGNIRRYVDYRIGNNRPIHPWRRPAPATESWMTSILLDKVLGEGDAAFEALTGQSVGPSIGFKWQAAEDRGDDGALAQWP